MRLYEIENNINLKRYSDSIKKFKEGSMSIFRGSRYLGSHIPIERTPLSRKSQNTRNYITTLVSNLPAWTEYPRRNNCWVMSTNYNYANIYSGGKLNTSGNIYHVFPENDSIIGVCSDQDFFGSFERIDLNIHYFNMKMNDNRIDQNNFTSIMDFLQENWDKIRYSGEMPKTFDEFLTKFTPKYNGFSLFNTKNWQQIEERECWTEATCLFVPVDYMTSIEGKYFIEEV
jgi:hypothetical protein